MGIDSEGFEIEDESPLKRSGFREVLLKIGGVLAVQLHPGFLFFYIFLFILVIQRDPSFQHIWVIISGVFVLTVLLPALFPIIYAKDGFLKDRRKRPLSILFTLLCYIGCLFFLELFSHVPTEADRISFENNIETIEITNVYVYIPYASIEVALFILAYLICGLFCAFIISFWYKISLHANGIGFLFTLSLLLTLYLFSEHVPHYVYRIMDSYWILFIACSAVLLWQRVASGSHTIMQVVLGFLLPVLLPIILLLVFGRNFDFATSVIPGWHTTILPPMFHFPRFW